MNQQMYTTKELQEMSSEDLRVAQANNFVKPEAGPAMTEPGCTHPECILVHPHAGPAQLPRTPAFPPQDPYAVTAWGETEYDFRVPSGQLCRMRKLRPETLLETGLLDKVTRLPGFAEEQIQKAEGQPPTMATLPDKEDIQSLIAVLDKLIPMVVVKPYVCSAPEEGQERVPGVVYTDDIELSDRIAIMERAMTGVKKLDNFRAEPGGAVPGVVDESGHAVPTE